MLGVKSKQREVYIPLHLSTLKSPMTQMGASVCVYELRTFPIISEIWSIYKHKLLVLINHTYITIGFPLMSMINSSPRSILGKLATILQEKKEWLLADICNSSDGLVDRRKIFFQGITRNRIANLLPVKRNRMRLFISLFELFLHPLLKLNNKYGEGYKENRV